MLLNGDWQATRRPLAGEEASKPGFVHDDWLIVPVPAHWQQVRDLEYHTGTLWYRREFEMEAPPPEAWARLTFDGTFYRARVWLNGALLGEHEGYFLAASYAVESRLRPGLNVLAVEVSCPVEPDVRKKRQITGVFAHWDAKDPLAEPGGLWRDVHLEWGAGPRLADLRLASDLLSDSLALVHVTAEVEAFREERFEWEATVEPKTFSGEPVTVQAVAQLRPGVSQLRLAVPVNDPRLWWTWDQGMPHLYQVAVGGQAPSGPVPFVHREIGIRKVELRDWVFYLNSRRIFLRGANYAPADTRLARATAADYQRDVQLAVGANMNMLRVHAHLEKPEFYQACARQGLLLWQDFPLQWGYDRSALPEADRQIRGMVRLLGSETAVGLWCCHNEPFALAETEATGGLELLRNTAGSLGSNWFKRVMDPLLARAVEEEDPTRPVIPYSGDFGFLHGGQDAHHYWGWYLGQMTDLERILNTFPKTARMVSEYGAQAFPAAESCREFVRGDWPDINWQELAERYMLQPDIMGRFVRPGDHPSFEAYAAATQEYQATLLKYYNEQLRRRKYRPTGGALVFMLADGSPGVSWSLLDYRRRPKPAYDQVRRDFSPVHLMAGWPESSYRRGKPFRTRITFVNDLPHPVEGRWTWHLRQGDTVLVADTQPVHLPPDSLVEGPQIRWTVPTDLALQPLVLALRLESRGEVLSTNEYRLRLEGERL